MKKLYIAEKPDVGRALASFMWPNDENIKKTKNYISNDDTIVTWVFGHILGLAEPEEYGKEFKQWSHYPIVPQKWILKPAAASSEHLNIIKDLLSNTDTVIHAGDPDREGQLLIDEVLRFCNYNGTVQRLHINAKDEVSMKRSFEQIVDNKKFENLYYAGVGRQQADWLVGMNLTRAYTTNARKYGYDNTFKIGRVKIPTLALVVNREKEIKKFKATKHYVLKGTFDKDGLPFTAMFQPSDKLPLDEENRIKDKKILQAVKMKLEKSSVVVKEIDEKDMLQNPPLPHSLDTLQIDANKEYDISPKDVLATVQSLYEKKYVSYPRSDCNYIPASQKDDAKRILPILQELKIPGADNANLTLTSKAFNDDKITAHHAIIPTGVIPQSLNDNEKKIYDMIASRYIVQFYPPYRFKKITFTLAAGDELFTGSGKIIKDLGFKVYTKDDAEDKDENNIKLPNLVVGASIDKASYSILDKTTTPPKRFTEGTLVSAMANIWRFIDAKNPNKEKLKSVKGIGTPATRDTIIAELQQTSIKGKTVEPCMKKVKKELVPTAFGINLIENVDPLFIIPDTTADMEYALAEISEGKKSLSEYMDEVLLMVHQNIQYAENRKFPLPPGKEAISCPICSTGEIIRKYSSKINKHFHICSNENCVSPDTGKKLFFEDDNGKPIMVNCPECKTILSKTFGKNGPFWICNKCKKTYNDINNKPDISKKKG